MRAYFSSAILKIRPYCSIFTDQSGTDNTHKSKFRKQKHQLIPPAKRNCPHSVPVDAVDGPHGLAPEAVIGYPLASLDEIRIKRPSLEPLRGRFKAIAVNLHGSSFRLGVNDERGRTAALGKMRLDEHGKSAALKIKTPHSYSEVPRWKMGSD